MFYHPTIPMLTATIKIQKEGIVIGVAHSSGKPWAEYYLVGQRADNVANMIIEILGKCEPIRGDKHTLREFVKMKKKGKKK